MRARRDLDAHGVALTALATQVAAGSTEPAAMVALGLQVITLVPALAAAPSTDGDSTWSAVAGDDGLFATGPGLDLVVDGPPVAPDAIHVVVGERALLVEPARQHVRLIDGITVLADVSASLTGGVTDHLDARAVVERVLEGVEAVLDARPADPAEDTEGPAEDTDVAGGALAPLAGVARGGRGLGRLARGVTAGAAAAGAAALAGRAPRRAPLRAADTPDEAPTEAAGEPTATPAAAPVPPPPGAPAARRVPPPPPPGGPAARRVPPPPGAPAARRVPPPPPPAPATAAWAPTHLVPEGGLDARDLANPDGPPTVRLAPGIPLRLVQRSGDWARVDAANGWGAWVDGRLLVPVRRSP